MKEIIYYREWSDKMDYVVLLMLSLFYIFVLLPDYINKNNKFGMKSVLKSKLTLSAVFCIVGFKGMLVKDFSIYSELIFCGLLFSMAGDYFLFFIDKNEEKFIIGIFMFAITQIIYISAMTLLISYSVWEFIITLIVFAVVMIMIKKVMKLNLRRAEIPLTLYSFLLILMTVKSLMVFYLSSQSVLFKLLLSLGAVLFFISDSLLGMDHFMLKKPVLKNSRDLPYFIGQLFIASSLYF